MDINSIFNLYDSRQPKQTEYHDSSRGDDDIRKTYIVEYSNGEKYAIKVCKNAFTTPVRVKGWAELIEHYNRLNIYCPKIIQNRYGDYTAQIDGFLVYAEEYMKYQPAAGRNDAASGERKYEKQLYESIGLVAANPAPLVPWHTAYCIYDKFDENDKYDENLECAIATRDFYRDNIPKYAPKAEALFREYCRRREKFESVYRLLPKSVFQGDLNSSNILVDRDGSFKGLIDFNLSGTETILNYAFCESYGCLEDDSEIDLLLDSDALKKRDGHTKLRLSWIGTRYKFTDFEKEVFNEYYNIVAPFRWPYHCFFLTLLNSRDKYPDGRKYAGLILDWIEYQMTRNDVGCFIP